MSGKKTRTFSANDKPDIDYPCKWQYKVIGEDGEALQAAIKEVCAPVPVAIHYSHSSSGGKYHSYSAEIEVQDEEARIAIFQALHNHSAVKFVI